MQGRSAFLRTPAGLRSEQRPPFSVSDSMVDFVTTPALRSGYEQDGPRDGTPASLLYGWPDDIRTF